MSKQNEVYTRLVELGVVFTDGLGWIDKEEMRPKLNPDDPVDAQIVELINEKAFPPKFEVRYAGPIE